MEKYEKLLAKKRINNELKSYIIKEEPLDPIEENQRVMCLLVVPTGIEPVSPA